MFKKCVFNRGGPLVIIIWTIIIALLFQPLTGAFAQVKGVCEERLKEAEKKFYDGFFDEAITLLNQCLKEPNIAQQERAKAHELLAKVYLGKDYLDQAENALKKLLELVPTYSANPERDTPTFVALVDKVKAEQPKPPEPVEKKEDKGAWYTNTWVLVGAGAAVAGGVAVLLLTGKKETEKVNPLPGPPSLP
ncbi:MAG: tetratricopeptide repeat protein [Bacteroidota bacterium]|nr:tetratricopeptide repeat protein [Bacteroidota bacterium]